MRLFSYRLFNKTNNSLCEIADQWQCFTLNFSPVSSIKVLLIANFQRAESRKPVQVLSSGSLEWICAVRITTTPLRHVSNQYHYVKIVRFRSYSRPYSVQIRENTDQDNSEYGHFSHSDQSLVLYHETKWFKASYCFTFDSTTNLRGLTNRDVLFVFIEFIVSSKEFEDLCLTPWTDITLIINRIC